MDKEYHVTIIKTIKTVVIVPAQTAVNALYIVENYGYLEAMSDYSVVSEVVSAKIAKVVRAD